MRSHETVVRPLGIGEAHVNIAVDGGWYQLLVPSRRRPTGALDRDALEAAIRAEWARRHPEVELGAISIREADFAAVGSVAAA